MKELLTIIALLILINSSATILDSYEPISNIFNDQFVVINLNACALCYVNIHYDVCTRIAVLEIIYLQYESDH